MIENLSIIMVTYNPGERTYESLVKLIRSDYVRTVYIVDNSLESFDLKRYIPESNKLEIVRNGDNKGIGAAQNIGIELAIKDGQQWVMTLDHDTIVEDELLIKYIRYINTHDTSYIAILGTDYMDINTKKEKFGNNEPIAVRETISSGSLINLSIATKIGLMKEKYIIDQVDNEYCLRAQKYGYKILILPGKNMEHKLGNILKKKIFGHEICLYNQSPIRTYYRTRNMIWLAREYGSKEIWKEKVSDLIKDLFRILLESQRAKKIQCFAKGIKHGLFTQY